MRERERKSCSDDSNVVFFRSQTNALWRVAMMEPFVSGTSSKPNELCVITDCSYRPTDDITDHVIRGRPNDDVYGDIRVI